MLAAAPFPNPPLWLIIPLAIVGVPLLGYLQIRLWRLKRRRRRRDR